MAKTKLGRPRITTDRKTLNLSIESQIKRKAFEMATNNRTSISELFSQMVESRYATEQKKAA